MKKRRALALLLALSLSVSMNGMTVLATASGSGEPSVTTEEGSGMSGEEETSGSQENAGDEKPKGEQTGSENAGSETNPGGSSEGDSGSENNGENSGSPEDPDKKDESGDPDNTGGQNPGGEDNKEEKPSDEEGETKPGEENPDEKDPTVEEDPEEGKPGDEKAEESVSENTVGEEEETEELPELEMKEARMVTFTDNTGMRVTYNANAEYELEIADGTLNGIKVRNSNGQYESVKGVVSVPAEDADGQKITAIGSAFRGNKDITYVKLPTGVTSIQESAFSDCTKLEGIYLPNGITSIGDSTFESCTRLLKIAIPKKVTSIGNRAFYQNSSLFMVYMQDADYSELTSIGDQAFYQCSKLESFASDKEFILPSKLESIGASAFYECRAIRELDLPASVRTMGESAFQRCIELRELSLSPNLETIAERAFAGCNKLVSVIFKDGNKNIGEAAFEGCIQLGHVELDDVSYIGNRAFWNCSGLISVKILDADAEIGYDAFPNTSKLSLIGVKKLCSAERYIEDNGLDIKFVLLETGSAKENYYKYTTATLGAAIGTLEIRDAAGKDPNGLNGGDGVPYGTTLYVRPVYGEGVALVTNSVKCNGEVLQKDSSGRYPFTMKVGGVHITAEFVNTSDKKTQGTAQDIKVRVSNGRVENNADGEAWRVRLKVGQYSGMFLTDEQDDNKRVASTKIKYSSDKPAVVSVKSDGTIQALKVGTASITAKMLDAYGKEFSKKLTVIVEAAGVEQLKIKAVEHDISYVTTEEIAGEVQSVVIKANDVKSKPITFKLRATAYDEEDDKVAVPLKWTSSDVTVAKLSAASTTVNSTDNTVTVPKNASGEATIRVTATVDKKTVTQKFIIRVKDTAPRLVQKSIAVNPNRADGARLQIVSSYGKAIDPEKTVLQNVKDNYTRFPYLDMEYMESESDDTVITYRIMPIEGIDPGTYSLCVRTSEGSPLPLTVTVKASVPNPKAAFVKNQPKLNLFYAKDGTEFTMNISNLGKEEVSRFELRPLSNKEDDQLFTKNFEVERVSKDSCVIRQKNPTLLRTNKNTGKPVVTGYLRLYYEGYASNIYKDLKITIPTQRVAPYYKLNRTTDTFKKACGSQEIELQLVDKKNQPVDLSDGGYALSIVNTGSPYTPVEVSDDGSVEIDETGKFKLTLVDGITKAGTVSLRLTNSKWAAGEAFKFSYSVKLVDSNPTISLTDRPGSTTALRSSTIAINTNYPEQELQFGLKSSLQGTYVADEQVFEPKTTAKTEDEYKKLVVKYENGVGTVKLLDSSIKNGTYTYVCNNAKYTFGMDERTANKITLKVSVKKNDPSVSVKGSLSLNNTARREDRSLAEKAELTLVTKNLPDEYKFDESQTEIKCITRNRAGYEENFNWELVDSQIGEDGKIIDGKLLVSLEKYCEKGTYQFSMTPAFTGNGNTVYAKLIKFSVKVHDGEISVSLSAKGKLNLLDRLAEDVEWSTTNCTVSNSIVYTPALKNVKDSVSEVKIFDDTGRYPKWDGQESSLFEGEVLSDGKIYVRPKADAVLENNKTYKVWIWMELDNYKFPTTTREGQGRFCEKVLSIKTAQVLPKVTTDVSSTNLYLSNKDYTATFIINKKDVKAIGQVESIAFGEKDTNAQESFVTTEDVVTGKDTIIDSEQLPDGSLKVKLRLRNTVFYKCNTTNKLTMYVKFKGQGTNTAGTAISMNVVINK